MQNRKSNTEVDRPRDLTYCSHKRECIVTTNPDIGRGIWLPVLHCDKKTRQIGPNHEYNMTFQSHLMNVRIRHLKCDYDARRGNRFACYSHCYVTWRFLTPWNVTLQCPSARNTCARDAQPNTLISACLKLLKMILPQENILTIHLRT